MVSLATAFFLFGALIIHEVCGTTGWFGHRGHSNPDRKKHSSDPVLKFEPGGKGPKDEHHGSRNTRSIWRTLYHWAVQLFGESPTDQELSERRKKWLEEKIHNISEHGQGYGDFGGGGLAGHHPDHFYYYDYYFEGPGVELR
ncbi:unnamed protein product [Cylicocyclus nassatus]|uniref:Uncharacterized protein n=1 Tax=Cylicocyclus nassatus TaxID=53992 RepID=A0AA36M1Q1_CYLNA|nr:unnamed protein product [Cylicocyclus nassatus]